MAVVKQYILFQNEFRLGKYTELTIRNKLLKTQKKANIQDVKTGKVIIHQASVSSIPYNTNFFNLITAFQTHYFWPDVEQDIKEVFRVLQPNGSFLLVAETFKIQYHMEKYKTTEELINLFYKTGFKKCEVL